MLHHLNVVAFGIANGGIVQIIVLKLYANVMRKQSYSLKESNGVFHYSQLYYDILFGFCIFLVFANNNIANGWKSSIWQA